LSTRRLLLPLALIFGTILLVQLVALQLRSRASALEHGGQLRLAVAANQRLVVEQYERSSYLAGLALSTENWGLLIGQRSQATQLARVFEETRTALVDGGTVALGREVVPVAPSPNPEVKKLLSEAAQAWQRATAAQVRMLRSSHKELKGNTDLDEFRVQIVRLTSALDRTERLLRADHIDEQHRAATTQMALPIFSAALLLVLGAFIYLRMLRPLAEATARATELNTGLQLVLDTVDQGLIIVDRQNQTSKERSATLERWLGSVPEGSRFAEALRRHHSGTAARFDLALGSIFDGFLPEEVGLDQLPTRIIANGRSLQFKYKPIRSRDGVIDKLLVVLSDTTDEQERRRVEAEQIELVTLFQHIAKDRAGFEAFLAESSKCVELLLGPCRGDAEAENRALHTLKGNTATFGLLGVAALCHEIEEKLTDELRCLNDTDAACLQSKWSLALERSRLLLGGAARDVLEVDLAEHAELVEQARQHGVPQELIATLAAWADEPVHRRFERFADQARSLAERLGKPRVEVQIEAGRVRLSATLWAGFWAAFVHAVRNAVDHGIEAPDARRIRGKSPAGKLTLNAAFRGDELQIVIQDDGEGIRWDRVKANALAAGLPCQSQEQLVEVLFRQGVTTKGTATSVSGRGIGMDALKNATEALGGSVHVSSERDRGTRVEFLFPRSSASESRLLCAPVLARA
jgi:signal transduction histidine kinase